ncbi:MAG: hypothetical protein WCI01_11390 [Chlorobiaceae bacterium]
MPLNLSKTVLDFLQARTEEKFTARQIADWILKTYPSECREKRDRSKATVIRIDSDEALVQQLAAEIASQRPVMEKRMALKTTEGRPRKYYYSSKTAEAEVAATEDGRKTTGNESSQYTEHDLYPILSEFLWREFSVFSKRIDEKRSRNSHGSGGNRWLFPDLIGVEDLSRDWHTEIKHCVQEISDRKTKLWSFEVKKLINRANVREAYFQAVSNSSWANIGYLVTAEIQGAEKEMRMLAGLHGIGLIKLDIESPADSEIMIPARERMDVDWNTANRLAEENQDFMECVKLVRQFYQTGNIRETDWDIPKD